MSSPRSRRLAGLLALAFSFLLLGLAPALAQDSATSIPHGTRARLARVLRVPGDFAAIQPAIDAARDGDVVLVGPGTYTGSLDFLGKAIEVVATQGPGRTTLRTTGENIVVRFGSGEGPDSKLLGFRITGGAQEGFGGSGVSCLSFTTTDATPYLADCVIEQNFGLFTSGVGVAGNPILERCIVRNNQGTLSQGGGVNGAPTLIHCLVEGNEACDGGGLYLQSGAHLESTIVRNNRSGPCNDRGNEISSMGGGLFVQGTGVTIERCVLQGNGLSQFPEAGDPASCNSWMEGGALNGGGATLRRCTVFGNVADVCATVGGLSGGPTVIDSIVRANDDPVGHYAGDPGVRFSNVDGGGGPGSIDLDPLFVDPSAGDFRLHPGSPCIDAGDPAGALDPDGTRADLGAYPRAKPFVAPTVEWRAGTPFAPADPLVQGFGRSIAVAGDTAVVGANAGDDGEHNSAFVFRRAGGVWTEQQQLALHEVADGYGASVALSGNVAVVGAPVAGFFTGAVHVYERASADEPFGPGTTLVPDAPIGGEAFGTALALEGGLLAVGAPADPFSGVQGRVVVFRRGGRGRWVQVAVLVPPPSSQDLYSTGFGSTLDLSGRTLVVGAPLRQGFVSTPGAVFVFERAGDSPWSWLLSRSLAEPVQANANELGSRVAIEGDSILVTSANGTFAYEHDEPGLPWSRGRRVDAIVGGELLMDGDRAWRLERAGAPPFAWTVHALVQPSPGADWVLASTFEVPAASGLAAADGALLVGTFGQHVVEYTAGFQLDGTVLDQAADGEALTLVGARLDEVAEVRIGTQAQAIVSQTPTSLVIQPAPHDPGFADLTLVGPSGALTRVGGFESLPSLRAASSGLGGTLSVDLHNGEPGAYLLRYSFDLRATPLVLSSPPTWFHFFLALTPGRSGTLATDAFTGPGRAELTFPLPNDPALSGQSLYLQAWCQRGLFGPARYSFTNQGSVTL